MAVSKRGSRFHVFTYVPVSGREAKPESTFVGVDHAQGESEGAWEQHVGITGVRAGASRASWTRRV